MLSASDRLRGARLGIISRGGYKGILHNYEGEWKREAKEYSILQVTVTIPVALMT